MALSLAEYNAQLAEEKKQRQREDAAKAALIVTKTSSVNPDAYAQDMQLGKAFGAPMLADTLQRGPAIAPLPEGVPDPEASKLEMTSRLARLKAETTLSRAPVLSGWLGIEQNAKVAHDDLDGLALVEQQLRGVNPSKPAPVKPWEPGASVKSYEQSLPTWLKYPQEAGKGIGYGAIDTFASAATAGAYQAGPGAPSRMIAGSAAVGEFVAGMAEMNAMSPIVTRIAQAKNATPEELDQLRADIQAQTDINPNFAQSTLSDVLDGTTLPEQVEDTFYPGRSISKRFAGAKDALMAQGMRKDLANWAGRMAGHKEGEPVPPIVMKDEGLLAAGNWLSQKAQEMFGAAPGWETSNTVAVSRALGMIGAMIGMSTAGRGLGVGNAPGMLLGVEASAGEPVRDAIQAGMPDEVVQMMAGVGVISGLTDIIPLERYLDVPALKETWGYMMKEVAKSAMYEGGQEVTQQLMNDLFAAAVYGGGSSINELWENFKVGGIAGAVTTAAQMLLRRHGPGFMGGNLPTKEDIATTKEFYDSLTKTVTTTKLSQRLPPAMRQFVEAVTQDGPVDTMYVPGKEFVAYFQQFGLDKVAAEIPGVRVEDIVLAAETGGDVAIPIASWASNLAATPHNEFILQNARMDPEGYTIREATEINARMSEIMQQAREVRDNAIRTGQAEMSSGEALAETMTQRLTDVGYAPDAARQSARVISDGIVAMASRLGVTPEQVVERFGLPSVRGGANIAPEAAPDDAFKRTLEAVRQRRVAKAVAQPPAGQTEAVDTTPVTTEAQDSEGVQIEPTAVPDGLDIPVLPEMDERQAAILDEVDRILEAAGADPAVDDEATIRQKVADFEASDEGKRYAQMSTRLDPVTGDTPDRISTRQPGLKSSTEDPLAENLIIDLAAMKANPKAFAHNMEIIRNYPGFRTTSEDPNVVAEEFLQFVEDNLVWLYNQVPAEIRDRSKLWYVGARKITEQIADDYDLPDFTVAGVLAALSPQKDWYQNVSLAERVIDIHERFKNDYEFRFSNAMAETADRIFGKDQYAADMAVVRNSSYAELENTYLRAMWLRTYDETYNPRGYRTVSSEGDFIGDPAGNVAWGSGVEIGKAIHVLQHQTREATSQAMGDKHKVRNFFNNILAPMAPHGDVTIDTHAIAAALVRPLSGSAPEVAHNFGNSLPKDKQPEGWSAAKAAAISGAEGTYGIYADAYRRAAARVGVLPREMQSITWEAIRGMFPAVDKRSTAKNRKNAEIWAKAKEGVISYEAARNEALKAAGGISDPTWYRPGGAGAGAPAPTSYEGELAEARAARRASGGERTGADAGGDRVAPAGRGNLDQRAADTGREGGYASGSLAPLEGAPVVAGASGPDANLVAVADAYAASIGVNLKRQAEFVEVDPERAARIAAAYEAMPHAPNDPAVAEAYDNLIRQTTAQYKALADAGYRFWFMDPENPGEYGASPWNAMRDLRANKRMGVFPTTGGFGTLTEVSDNPMLADTGIMWPFGGPDGPLKPVLANDLFRAVHDAFGHGLEGAGFRARGEENAWQAHIRLFTGSAQGAITSETRGQNSWLNYGPYGEQNRNAKVEDTIFADQKTGLMPSWTWEEGRAGDMPAGATYDQTPAMTSRFQQLLAQMDAIEKEAAANQWNFRDPAEGLIVTHGISTSLLKSTLSAGGKLPMPSLAVTRASEPLLEFGDAILLGSSDLVDATKDPRNKVYGGDIWSSTYPQVNKLGTVEKFNEERNNWVEAQIFDGARIPSALGSAYDYQAADMMDASNYRSMTTDDLVFSYLFLRMIGVDPDPLIVTGAEAKTDPGEVVENDVADAMLEDPWLLQQVQRALDHQKWVDARQFAMVIRDKGDLFASIMAENIKSAAARYIWEAGQKAPEGARSAAMNAAAEVIFPYGTDEESFNEASTIGEILSDIKGWRLGRGILEGLYNGAIRKNGGGVNVQATKAKFRRALLESGMQADLASFTTAMINKANKETVSFYDEEAGDRVTVEATPENIVKAMMANQGPTGNQRNAVGTGEMVNLRAAVTPQFGSPEEIKKWRSRISQSEFQQAQQDAEMKLETWAANMRAMNSYRAGINALTEYGSYEGGELTMERFIDAMWPTERGSVMAAYNGEIAPQEAFFGTPATLTTSDVRARLDGLKQEADDFLHWLVAMPTEYLEAKPERVVDLKEFKAAIVPDYAGKELVEELMAQGLLVYPYTTGTSKTSLIRAVAADHGLLFQSTPKGPKGQIQFPVGGVGQGDTVVRIFENADLSTFLHEAGHWHLATLKALAEDPSTPAGSGIKEDWETIKGWWRENAKAVAKDAGNGVTEEDVVRAIETGTSGDQQKDVYIDVGMHEQFARGFEAYLMEGKAPSAELASAFAAFRSWLVAIYNSIKNLGVQLTPEVKSVMDRMLATKEQIEQAEKAAGGEMLFKSAAEMGVDEASYQSLVKLHEAARNEAERRLLAKFLKPILDQKKAEWRSERAEIRAGVEREVNARPVYRVLEWLGNRRWLGEGQPEELPFLTMDQSQLVAAYGEEVLAKLPRGFHRLFSKNPETSMHPDEVAGWFGYETGDEMIRELIEAKPRRELIEATTDELMLQKHGDPLKDGSAEREALEAYHADTRARFLQAEMDALFKRMGPKGSPSTLSISREIARRAIAGMPVRRAIVTGSFLKAERNAGFDAQKALASGDIEAAAKAKRMQLLNNLMWVEARKAAAETARIERLAKRLSKKSVRESLAGSYLEAIDQLLEQYDFRKTSAKADQRRDALARYVAEMTAAGRANELQIPDKLIEQTKRIPYKTLTVEELRGVGDALRNIEHMARLKQKLLDAKAAREMDDVVNDIGQAFEDNIKAKPPSRGQPTAGEKWRTGLQRYLNLWLSADTILNEIDGFETGKLGKVYQHIKGRIDAAQAELVNRRHKAAGDIETLFSPYSRKERQQMGIARQHAQLGAAYSKWELISMALNMGNEGGMERLTNKKTADYLSPVQLEYVKSQLDARDWKFVQDTWDYINSFWPEIEAREKRVTGVTPKKVPPLPVETPVGVLRGGYYPIVYDTRLNSRADALEAAEVANQMKSGAFGKAQTWNGFTKERSAETRMRLRYDVGVISKHVNGVLHDLALSEPVTASSRILSDQRVRDLFTNYGRQDDLNTLDVWLLDVASGDIVQGDMLNGAARRIKGTFTVGKLLYSIPTALLQATGVFQSAVVVGKANFLRGLGTYLKNPAVYRDIVQRSDFMRERMTTFNKDLVDLRNDLTKNGPLAGRYSRFMSEVFVPAGFWAMIRAQFHLVDVPTWIAAYQSGTRDGMSEADAAAYADRMVARAATSGLQTDRSAIERGSISKNNRQQDVVRLFTALGSYMFAKMNVAYGRVRGTNYTSPMQVANLATDLVLLFAVEGVLAALVRGGLPDDDDDDGSTADDWAWTIARETGLSVTGGLPGIRDVASVVQGFSGGGAYGGFMETVGRSMSEVAELGGEIAEGDIDFTRSDAKNWVNAMNLFVALPTSQINRSIVNPLFDAMEGDGPSSPLEAIMRYGVGQSKQ